MGFDSNVEAAALTETSLLNAVDFQTETEISQANLLAIIFYLF